MKSAFLAVLLICNLMICPLRCLSHETKASGSQDFAMAVCACCSHCQDTPLSECPEPCSDGCDCENCICEGAVLETDVELSPSITYFGEAQPASLAAAAIIQPSEPVVRDKASTTRQLLSGRELRVSHQSWLL